MQIETITAGLRDLWAQAVDIWQAGGWAMIAIAAIAFTLFGLGVHIALRLTATGHRKVREEEWRRWIHRPRDRDGPIGELIERVTVGDSLADMQHGFEQLRGTELTPFARDLKVMKIFVSAAPLVGLLGTVTGMLATFGALASGSGGEKTMNMVAGGISEALITTETGLVIALPGLFFQYHLARRFETYKAFLAHLETVCTQIRSRTIASQGSLS